MVVAVVATAMKPAPARCVKTQAPLARSVLATLHIRAGTLWESGRASGYTVLPWALWSRAGRFRAQGSHRRDNVGREGRVSVEDEVSGGGVERERLAELLNDPHRVGMVGHVEVNDPSTAMFNHEPDVEEPERDRWDDEEVHGGDGVAVVAKEGHPALDGLGLGRAQWHEARHRALGELEAKHPQFTMDARGTPGRVLGRQSPDQCANLGGHAGTAAAAARGPVPVQAEAGPVPADHSVRLHEHEDLGPPSPEATQDDPETSDLLLSRGVGAGSA